jgi:hypothetical protein
VRQPIYPIVTASPLRLRAAGVTPASVGRSTAPRNPPSERVDVAKSNVAVQNSHRSGTPCLTPRPRRSTVVRHDVPDSLFPTPISDNQRESVFRLMPKTGPISSVLRGCFAPPPLPRVTLAAQGLAATQPPKAEAREAGTKMRPGCGFHRTQPAPRQSTIDRFAKSHTWLATLPHPMARNAGRGDCHFCII